MNLVVGSDGVLGTALMRILPDVKGTSRKPTALTLGRVWFDLGFDADLLPQCDVAYLCAGTKGFVNCEGNHAAFRSDVDGNIRVVKYLLKLGAFVVFISSDAVEWSNSGYGRNRAYVEMAIVMIPNVAIIRPSGFGEHNVENLAKLCAEVGEKKLEGVHYWGKR